MFREPDTAQNSGKRTLNYQPSTNRLAVGFRPGLDGFQEAGQNLAEDIQ